MRDLGTLPFANSSVALGINNKQQVVGESDGGFLYSGGVMTDLGTADAQKINDAGQITGTISPNGHAYILSNGILRDIGTLGGDYGAGLAINASGQVVGQSDPCVGCNFQAFFYSGGVMRDLGFSSDVISSTAAAINNSGQIVGDYSGSAGMQAFVHAYIYSGGVPKDLGIQTQNNNAFGINDNGDVVGIFQVTKQNTDHAFLYRGGAVQDLNDLIDPNSGWVVEDARAINNMGQIAATGTRNGQTHALLLTPPGLRLETENLIVQALSGATHSTISDANLSAGAGTQLNATGKNQYVVYTVPVNGAGTYKVGVGVKTGPTRGIFQMSVGDVNQGKAQDEYSATIGYGVRDLGTVSFSTGGNKAFKFLVTGKNASSGGDAVAFDYIELVPTNRLETESLKVQAITSVPSGYSSAQWFGVFNASAASGGGGTYFNANAVGNYITYTVPIATVGTYRIRVGTQTKPNKGIFRLAINGVSQGLPQDEYSSSVAYGVADLGTVYLNPGNQAFSFTVAGKNASSTGYTLAFDYIELIPTFRQETESLKVAAKTPPPNGITPAQWFGMFNATAASGGAGAYFNATAPGQLITYTVPVAKAGTYHVQVGIQTKPNKGTFQLAINGVSQGAVQDEYDASVGYVVRDLGTVYLNSGNQAFKFTVAGKNASSTGYTLAFDYIELVP